MFSSASNVNRYNISQQQSAVNGVVLAKVFRTHLNLPKDNLSLRFSLFQLGTTMLFLSAFHG
jgi:hypothetical protein